MQLNNEQLVKVRVTRGIITGHNDEGGVVDATVGQTCWVRPQAIVSLTNKAEVIEDHVELPKWKPREGTVSSPVIPRESFVVPPALSKGEDKPKDKN